MFADCYKSVAVPDEELDAPDGASGADAAVNDGSELRLQELASRLRADLKQLLLFDVSDHQVPLYSLRFSSFIAFMLISGMNLIGVFLLHAVNPREIFLYDVSLALLNVY